MAPKSKDHRRAQPVKWKLSSSSRPGTYTSLTLTPRFDRHILAEEAAWKTWIQARLGQLDDAVNGSYVQGSAAETSAWNHFTDSFSEEPAVSGVGMNEKCRKEARDLFEDALRQTYSSSEEDKNWAWQKMADILVEVMTGSSDEGVSAVAIRDPTHHEEEEDSEGEHSEQGRDLQKRIGDIGEDSGLAILVQGGF